MVPSAVTLVTAFKNACGLWALKASRVFLTCLFGFLVRVESADSVVRSVTPTVSVRNIDDQHTCLIGSARRFLKIQSIGQFYSAETKSIYKEDLGGSPTTA